MLRTERLLLRPWREDDLAPFARMSADPQVMRYMPSVLDREASDDLARRIIAFIDENGWGLWAVERADTPGFIGFVGLLRPSFEAPFTPCVEVGWRLAAEHWNQGFATEAARRALRFGFTELGLGEIVSLTTESNLPSRRVMEKIGMTRDLDGDFEHPRVPEGHPLRPHVLYRLSVEAWRAG